MPTRPVLRPCPIHSAPIHALSSASRWKGAPGLILRKWRPKAIILIRRPRAAAGGIPSASAPESVFVSRCLCAQLYEPRVASHVSACHLSICPLCVCCTTLRLALPLFPRNVLKPVYTVTDGDTMGGVAERFSVSVHVSSPGWIGPSHVTGATAAPRRDAGPSDSNSRRAVRRTSFFLLSSGNRRRELDWRRGPPNHEP